MKLPNGDRATIDIRKLRDYCLDPRHSRGKNKARVFAAALGLSSQDAPLLHERLLQAARVEEAVFTKADAFGSRYAVDCEFRLGDRTAVLRSVWLVPPDNPIPKLISCWVK